MDRVWRWILAKLTIETSSLEEFVGQVKQKNCTSVEVGIWNREHHKDGMFCGHHGVVNFAVHEIFMSCEAVTDDGRKIIFEVIEGDYPRSNGECPVLRTLEALMKPVLFLGSFLKTESVLEILRKELPDVEIKVLSREGA